MIGFSVLLFPFVLLGFVMLMGRVEEPLSQLDSDQEFEKFIERANQSELNTFVREGPESALRRFRNRLRPGRSRRARRRTVS